MRLVFAICCLQLVSAAAPPNADTIVGIWEVNNKKDIVHIEIKQAGGMYGGTIVWIKQKYFPENDPRGMGGQPKVDRNNPDPTLRTRPIVGVEVLGELRHTGNGEWKQGWLYAPDRGRVASCKMKLLSNGTLKVRGFIGHPIFGTSMQWRRLEE